ncbi:MAG: type II toxin-antitoxin system ParD family antitoxin [Phormidesmis sp. CAN_BIN44]|nr:type II toxin-antitoxin system ParD family antitoxin [Phormidesmis sp. CAN_BIN44]
MNITLKTEQEQFIQAKLQSGKYQTVDEIIAEAFRALEERDGDYQQWVEEIRERVDAAAASLDQGKGLEGEAVVNRILEKFRQARES